MIATALSLALALPACGDSGADAGAERRSAAGEVLGGEISDAMLPLDTVQSTSPVAPRASAPSTGGASGAAEGSDETTPQPEADDGAGPAPVEPDAEPVLNPPQE